MFSRLKFYQFLLDSRERTLRHLQGLVSGLASRQSLTNQPPSLLLKWSQPALQAVFPAFARQISRFLSNIESPAHTLRIFDPEIIRGPRQAHLTNLKLRQAASTFRPSLVYFSSRVLGTKIESDGTHISTGSVDFGLPDNVIFSIIYPRLAETSGHSDQLAKLARIGRMYLEICCWSYTMKYLSAPGRAPSPGCFVNGYNFNMLGYVSPYEEIAPIEEEDVKASEFKNTKSPMHQHRLSPYNDINLCRPESLAHYTKAIGLYDSIVYDSLPHNVGREQQAIAALYQTIGSLYQIHGPEVTRKFIDQRVMEGKTGLVWQSLNE
ncbi:uncharacterized protein SAPINGB_P002930 [Magnusiomyces paraingens]|uniref:Uncharacterized protein n=1 Tax=Magnusiomyces paraingens TaxID=2606893 RepID=A0A5E8BML8_9ASCO|nr:uncharacterized protein SAPINGB_P002930 [Saprochaete ingens]VVT50938.1 unnamed protein product [Saprochaete ingens]